MRRGSDGGFMRPVIGSLVLVGVASAVVASVFSVLNGSGELDQADLHDRGTRSQYADFSATVSQRTVIIPPVEGDAGGALGKYATLFLTGQAQPTIQGQYDPVTKVILIMGEEMRCQSTLPEPMRGALYRVLRHEYGHAAFFDWMEGRRLSQADALRVAATQMGSRPGEWPPELREVFDEWSGGDEYVYGDPYFCSNLSEYLAESYARILSGEEVPARTEAFVLKAYGGRLSDQVRAD